MGGVEMRSECGVGRAIAFLEKYERLFGDK